jgi:hypothetical protein
VSKDALVAVAYSPLALFTLGVVCLAIVPLSLVFAMKRLKGNMVAGGSNSLVLSAACHAIPRKDKSNNVGKVPPSSVSQGDDSMYYHFGFE